MNITSPIQTTLEPAQLNRLKKQAEDLEGVFLNLLTKEMFATVKSENGFGGGFGEETWRSMQAEQLANTMAQNGGLGIADQLLGDMIAMQEAAQKTQSRATGVYR
ncbi:rod-binding protein [Devosia sp. FJ2-5-3]|jgi:flagellar protein FlgJ|uniref:rod-binding protein n=1 Tax=Devosia sp. FJ2-5-3 TaxID=2976680 RepID=UPI0023D7DE3A|nr:rod-binding protein [Devosia sp. FJ2-5-3]WEJ59969.1 rod-binding protein [Devosia sp. FJ2-5-3]